MDDESLSAGKDADSKNQSDAQSADKPSEQRGNNVPAPDGNNVVETGFFHFARNVIIAGVFATGIWVIGEQFHNQGYLEIGNAANFLACVVFFTVAPFEALKHWRRPIIIWLLFLLFLIVPLALVFFGLKPKTESKPYPNFGFSILQKDRTMEGAVLLTNNFLNITNPGPVSIGTIFFPIKTRSDFILKLCVQNEGPIRSEDAWIRISVPKSLSCKANPGWEENDENTWTYRPPNLLSGDSWQLPDLHLLNLPEPPPEQPFIISDLPWTILVRANDSPSLTVIFNSSFVMVSSNISMIPIVEPLKIVNGKAIIPIPSFVPNPAK